MHTTMHQYEFGQLNVQYMSFFGEKYLIVYFSIILGLRFLLTVHGANLHKIRKNNVCLV